MTNLGREPKEGPEAYHLPVMKDELLELLVPRSKKIFVDATLGGGGHAELLLRKSSPNGVLIGIDRDPAAIKFAGARLKEFGSRVQIVHGRMRDVLSLVTGEGFHLVDGILADLGVSSRQLDDFSRGFSFRCDAPLDMRMDPKDEIGACELISQLSEKELADVIYEYGEERHARRIARAIAKNLPIESTLGLAKIIERAMPPEARRQKIHPATRTFQALRIAVNDEMGELQAFLNEAPKLLKVGGRMAIISYHSLEDRRVKHSFRSLAKEGPFSVLTKKAILPTREEEIQNPRSRSAKLRAIERTA